MTEMTREARLAVWMDRARRAIISGTPQERDALMVEIIKSLADMVREADADLKDAERELDSLRREVEGWKAKAEVYAPCEWDHDGHPDGEDDEWSTACGETYVFIDGGPIENSVRYCHGCGRPVEVDRVCLAERHLSESAGLADEGGEHGDQ